MQAGRRAHCPTLSRSSSITRFRVLFVAYRDRPGRGKVIVYYWQSSHTRTQWQAAPGPASSVELNAYSTTEKRRKIADHNNGRLYGRAALCSTCLNAAVLGRLIVPILTLYKSSLRGRPGALFGRAVPNNSLVTRLVQLLPLDLLPLLYNLLPPPSTRVQLQ
jgi:hypothetical protein